MITYPLHILAQAMNGQLLHAQKDLFSLRSEAKISMPMIYPIKLEPLWLS